MDNYQYRLLQLSIPTRTTKKEQEAFLREIFEKHIPLPVGLVKTTISTLSATSSNSLLLFKEAYVCYDVQLPNYMPAVVLQRASAKNLYFNFN